jgi:hypothetical protein
MKTQSGLVQSEWTGSSIRIRVPSTDEVSWFDGLLRDHHYLGAGRPVGDYLRQVVDLKGKAVALLVWGPACYALKDRDLWISWSASQRLERLKLIVQNRRFLVLAQKGESPNLASQAMGAALRALPEQWHQHFGYRPLLAESFTDPEAYAGTCYKASNWEAVGYSAGYSRHRADFYIPNERPKRLWLRPLVSDARQRLRSVQLPEECRAGRVAAPSGTLPVNAEQLGSLLEVFRKGPDPRDSNTRYRIGPVLTLIAMALLAGRREIAEIARFATTLSQPQRRRLCLPLKKGTRAFHKVPGYGVFYQVLTRMDPEAFAALLNHWLQTRAGTLPQALAMDGKMITSHRLLTGPTRGRRPPGRRRVRSEGRHAPLRTNRRGRAPGELARAGRKDDHRRSLALPAPARPDHRRERRRLPAPNQRQPAQPAQAGPGIGCVERHPLFTQTQCGHGRVETRRLHALTSSRSQPTSLSPEH